MARLVGVPVMYLSEVPEHWQEKAKVVLQATRGAAFHKAQEAGGVQPVIDITNLFPM